MRLAYFDCFSGIAGDMIIGALLNCGLDFNFLLSELKKLNLPGYELISNIVFRQGISATKFDVLIDQHQPHRDYQDILAIISESTLSDSIKNKSIQIFTALAKA